MDIVTAEPRKGKELDAGGGSSRYQVVQLVIEHKRELKMDSRLHEDDEER
jgi:hypothetical protein